MASLFLMVIDPTRIGTTPDRAAAPRGGGPREAPRAGEQPRRRRMGLPALDPFDLDAAFARLEKLLTLDRWDGPRADASARGFYLNILV